MAAEKVVLIVLAVLLAVSAFGPVVEAVTVAKKCTFAEWKSPALLGTRTIYVGTTCTWTWADDLSHCVDGKNKPPGFSSPVIAGRGQKWSYTFKKTGTFKYDCCLHLANMRGTIQVVPRPGAAKPPPPKCTPKCGGRCWGGDTCGGKCSKYYPNPPTNARCGACCRRANTNQKSIAQCYAACKKSK